MRKEKSIGYVYLIYWPVYNGALKIGNTENLDSRITNYRTSTPGRNEFELPSIVAYMLAPGYRTLEKKVLKEFWKEKILLNKEWISIPETSPEDIIDRFHSVGANWCYNDEGVLRFNSNITNCFRSDPAFKL